MTMRIHVNGEEQAVSATTVAELLRERGLPENGRGMAVAVNRTLVHRQNWTTAKLAPGDRVEIIRPIVGG